MIRIFLLTFLNVCTTLLAKPNLQARTGILVDYHSDEILFEMDADVKYIQRL